MIQFKSKHPYSSKHDRWYPTRWYPTTTPEVYNDLDFEDYMFILGDKIYREPSVEAEQAFNQVKMWDSLSV